ncbi:MAG TPA: gephyrin-like molybdotransferase Glp [Thermomicrobiales bacterium]|nr:gephyrin-like molybdotransferase Glp [Thermomicrobiales bacterium]
MPEHIRPDEQRSWENVEQMLSVDDARERILMAFSPLPAVNVPLLDAFDLILAEDVIAGENVPPFRNSAMDGYAVRAADTEGVANARGVRLRVIADLAAGYPAEVTVAAGTATRIMTGAPMPDGADAVVRFEETDEERASDESETSRVVTIRKAMRAGENVRFPGEDLRAGEVILPAGTRLRPAEIGVLAALNRATVPVHRRPDIAILSTGDEVIDLGPPLRPGQIRNSNSYLLAAMVRQFGGVPHLFGIAADSIDDLSARLRACREMDMIVTSGGVSLGDYDMVKDVLQAEGEIAIWQVRMKPGKPLAFGHIGGTPTLGLPGNPVAAAVSFAQFGRAAILKMLGNGELVIPTVTATLTERLDNHGRRRHFVRARLERGENGDYVVRQAGEQGAGVLSSLSRANGLLIIPEECRVAEPGMCFQVELLDWPATGL